MVIRILGCSIFVLAALARPALGVELAPFPVRNLSPLAQVHSLAIAEPSQLNRPGQTSARLGFDLANHATVSQRDDESIRLDGETYVATFGLRYGLAGHLQLGLDLPWVSHQRGFLDGFIRDWHNFFGLPNSDRDKLPDNELDFTYNRGNDEVLRLVDRVSGPGDLRLLLAWQWLASDQGAVSLNGTVKTPTGDAGDLSGSGGWDVSMAISGQRNFYLDGESVAVWSGLGGSWLGGGEVLAKQAKEWAANAWLGVGWSPLAWLGLKLQLDGHTPLYRSSLPELGEPALILTLGGNLAAGATTTVEIAVGEDLNVRTSPDFTCHLSLSHRF